MNFVRETRLLFGRALTQDLRNPVWLAVGFSTPLLYLALFTPLLKSLPGLSHAPTGTVLTLFLPGILSLVAFTTGSAQGFSTLFELQAGLIERLRVTPASRLAILAGPIVASLLMMTVFDTVLVVIAVAFGFPIHAGGLSFSRCCCGCSRRRSRPSRWRSRSSPRRSPSFAAVINAMNLPSLLLAACSCRFRSGRCWLRVLAHFDPLYYLVVAARALAVGNIGSMRVVQAVAVLIPLFVAMVWWATSVYRRAVA